MGATLERMPLPPSTEERSDAVRTLMRVREDPHPAELQLAIDTLLRWAGPMFTGSIEIHAHDGDFQVLKHPNRLTRQQLTAMVAAQR